MCTHTRLIKNRYTGQVVRVACGKCRACQQERANRRALRIKNNVRNGEICLFVTLTYANEFVPYVDRYELLLYHEYLTIWRDGRARRLRDGSFKREYFSHQLAYVKPDYDRLDFDPMKCRDLKNYPNKVGVLYYKDLQDFIKRLRVNLFRHENVEIPLSYFACGEYGGSYKRPHFHLLLFVPSSYEAQVRSAICESWPFDSEYVKRKSIEVARDAASYVASYVNCGTSVSTLFKTSVFRQKHSYSKSFGTSLQSFSLSEILASADRGSMSYRREVSKDGYKTVLDFPVPKYVINRYFPQFKGLAWTDVFTFSQLFGVSERRCFCSEMRELPFADYSDSWFVRDRNVCMAEYILANFPTLAYGSEDAHQFIVRQQHAFEYYHSVTGKYWYDYLIDYQRVWRCYESTLLRYSYYDDERRIITDFSNFYENAVELVYGLVDSDLADVVDISNLCLDANKRRDIVVKTEKLTELFIKKDKTKKVVNHCMVQLGYNV